MKAEIRELTRREEFIALGSLFADIWQTDEPQMSPDLLTAMAHSGTYIAGAYAGESLIGGLVGWLGVRDGQLLMHSHILGVVPGDQARGLGFDLKQDQRRWCLERGVKVMEWTTDPLVRRNAYFNLAKLGAEAPEYLVNFYGEMRDGINAGEESDRLLIRWQLDAPRSEPSAAADGATTILDAGPGEEPVPRESEARVLICQVPEDIVAMRAKNPPLARRWRLALREALGGAMARGYGIRGATKSGWYVLESASQ